MIGARSVVAKDIPDNSVAVGVSARVIKRQMNILKRFKEDLYL